MKRLFFVLVVLFPFIITGCDSIGKVLEVSPDSIVVYSDGTAQITTNVDDATYSVQDDYYASVSESGLVEGKLVGETKITVSSKSGVASIPVKVLPKYVLYPEMDGLIGKGLDDIVAAMGKSYSKSIINADGTITYSFDNPTQYVYVVGASMKGNVCTGILVVVHSSYASQLSKSLTERYKLAAMQNDNYLFLNNGRTVSAYLSIISALYIGVMYSPYTN